MSAFALAVFKAQAEDAIKMLINRRKSDFFIKTSVGGVAKQPVVSSLYFDEPKKCGAFFLTVLRF